MRVQRVVLEHHRDVAVFRRNVVDHPVADLDRPLGNVFQPGDHAQRGGFAAARGADEDHEFTVADFEVDVFHGGHVAVVNLVDVFQNHFCHLLIPFALRSVTPEQPLTTCGEFRFLEPARLRAHPDLIDNPAI
ncbi:hypothetical protein SDC9_172512 [bioreactor metagenome]|uniref:Uncharacterized protein n=1 Tax=bioreactor metagenome TaxID=1076179 RepID=A0A645GEJ5_9ZZZZ